MVLTFAAVTDVLGQGCVCIEVSMCGNQLYFMQCSLWLMRLQFGQFRIRP